MPIKLTSKTRRAVRDVEGGKTEPVTLEHTPLGFSVEVAESPYPPDTESLVHVTFTDGEVRTYPISASPRIVRFLGDKMAESGVLTLFCKDSSVGIPSEQIRYFEIEEYTP